MTEHDQDDASNEGPANAVSALPGTPADARAGFVALIGVPNAGKSTLLNNLVGTKVSIVSRKVQTTRALVRGIFIEGSAQVVLVDTPGIFAPKRRLDRAMVHSAWSGAADADAVCLLVDARKGVDDEVEAVLSRLDAGRYRNRSANELSSAENMDSRTHRFHSLPSEGDGLLRASWHTRFIEHHDLG